jgi:hypothetical protein
MHIGRKPGAIRGCVCVTMMAAWLASATRLQAQVSGDTTAIRRPPRDSVARITAGAQVQYSGTLPGATVGVGVFRYRWSSDGSAGDVMSWQYATAGMERDGEQIAVGVGSIGMFPGPGAGLVALQTHRNPIDRSPQAQRSYLGMRAQASLGGPLIWPMTLDLGVAQYLRLGRGPHLGSTFTRRSIGVSIFRWGGPLYRKGKGVGG